MLLDDERFRFMIESSWQVEPRPQLHIDEEKRQYDGMTKDQENNGHEIIDSGGYY